MKDGDAAMPAWRRVLAAAVRLLWQRRGVIELFLGILVPLSVFAALAEDVIEHQPFWWDDRLLNWLHAHATPGRDAWMIWASRLGVWWGLIPFSVASFAWLVRQGRTAQALFFALSVGGAGMLNYAAKPFFGRARPALWTSPALEQSFSFPSGHTMGSMALATALVVLAWPTRARWAVLLTGAAFVLLVSTSRLYLGVHYPSDVVAGWMASLVWVLGVRRLTFGQKLPAMVSPK